MEQTQPLEWDEDGDAPGAEATQEAPRPVGRLHLLSSKYGPEQDFWIYPGENTVGRLPSCRVCLPAPSVSKAHAVIEVPVPGGPHLLYDCKSLNRTRRQRAVLLPQVRYSLEDGDTLMFGDVGCQYFLLPPEGADPEDSLEVPPTQPRPPKSLAIEETPAPSKRMGYGALLARDSDDEEEAQGGGRLLHLPGSDGSNASTDTRRHSDAAFSSPSATVVPESDEEDGKTPDAPCPSLRLRYSTEKTPSPPKNGVTTNCPKQPEAMGVTGTDPKAEKQTDPRGPALVVFDLAKGPGHTGWGPVSVPEKSAVRGLGNGYPMKVESDTDVEKVPNPDVGQKSHGPAFLEDSNADMEEAAGNPEALDPMSPPPAIEVGSDTDVEEETGHPEVVKRHHQNVLHRDSDTDVEVAIEKPDVAQGMTHQPATSDSDTDVEEAGAKATVVGPKNHQPCAEVDSNTDVEEAAKSPDAVQKNHQVAVSLGGEREREDGIENPDGGHATSCPSAKNGDSDTDVDEVGETPKVAQKVCQPAVEVGSDTDVEKEEKAENGEVAQKTCQPAVEVGSDTDVEKEEKAESTEVAQKTQQLAMEVGSDTDVEEEENTEVAQKTHQLGMEVGSDTDVEEEEKVDNPEVGKGDVQPASKEFAALADSGTDVKKSNENPDVASKSHRPAVGGDSDTDVEEGMTESPDVVKKTHQDALAGSSCTDVVGMVGHQPAENGDSDTDVEEAPGQPDFERQKDLQPAMIGENDTDVEDAAKHPEVTQPESCVCSDTDVEDDADFALQATQCYLGEGPPSLVSHSARIPMAAVSVMSPPAGPALHAPVCTSSEKEEDSDADPCTMEVTQPFCEDPGHHLDQPTQAFIPQQEEEATQLLPCHPPPGGALSAEPAPLPVPIPASEGTLPSLGPQARSSPEGERGLPGRMQPEEEARRELPEEEESQPVRLVLSAPRRPDPVLQAVPEAAKRQETLEAAGITQAMPRRTGAWPDNAGKVTVLETHPIPSTTSRRRSLRSAPVPAPPSPAPAPAPERRSQRSGCPKEEESVGSRERSQPGSLAPPRKGRRQLCSPSLYMMPPEPGAQEEEQSGPVKRPRRVAESQAPSAKPAASGRARRSRGAANVEPGPADVPQGAEQGVQHGRGRRSQRTSTQELAARRRGAPEPAGEAQGKGRGVAMAEPPRAQGPEDAGSGTSQEQEAPAPRLRRQSSEKDAEAPRARAPRRSQGAASSAASHRVLFTGVIDEAGEQVVSELGGTLARSVFDCTHLVTDRVRRTVKFLCALARGVPIVTLGWLEKSGRSGCFLTPSSFLVQDAEQERNFQFSLAQSLQRARKGALLQGYEIHVTPNVKPEPEHMKDIIQCSGGVFLPHMPRAYKDQRVIVSCPEDLPRCRPAISARLPIASAELILTGILQQALDLDSYRLDNSPPPPPPGPAAPATRSSKRKGASGPAPAPPSSSKRRR